MFETMISGFVDSFPRLNKYKVVFTGVLCLFELMLGLPLVTRVNQHLSPSNAQQTACMCLPMQHAWLKYMQDYFMNNLVFGVAVRWRRVSENDVCVCMQGGMYVFQLLDWYVGAFSVITISLFECFILMFVYGEFVLHVHVFLPTACK